MPVRCLWGVESDIIVPAVRAYVLRKNIKSYRQYEIIVRENI